MKRGLIVGGVVVAALVAALAAFLFLFWRAPAPTAQITWEEVAPPTLCAADVHGAPNLTHTDETEDAALSPVALTFQNEAGAEISTGQQFELKWEKAEKQTILTQGPQAASQRFRLLVFSMPASMTVEGYGVMIVPPGASMPFGVDYRSDEMRLVVPLYVPEAGTSGTLKIRPLLDGPFEVRAAELDASLDGSFEVRPAQQPCTGFMAIDQSPVLAPLETAGTPEKVILSPDGRYALHMFEDRFDIWDRELGRQIGQQTGHEAKFLNSSRFVVYWGPPQSYIFGRSNWDVRLIDLLQPHKSRSLYPNGRYRYPTLCGDADAYCLGNPSYVAAGGVLMLYSPYSENEAIELINSEGSYALRWEFGAFDKETGRLILSLHLSLRNALRRSSSEDFRPPFLAWSVLHAPAPFRNNFQGSTVGLRNGSDFPFELNLTPGWDLGPAQRLVSSHVSFDLMREDFGEPYYEFDRKYWMGLSEEQARKAYVPAQIGPAPLSTRPPAPLASAKGAVRASMVSLPAGPVTLRSPTLVASLAGLGVSAGAGRPLPRLGSDGSDDLTQAAREWGLTQQQAISLSSMIHARSRESIVQDDVGARRDINVYYDSHNITAFLYIANETGQWKVFHDELWSLPLQPSSRPSLIWRSNQLARETISDLPSDVENPVLGRVEYFVGLPGGGVLLSSGFGSVCLEGAGGNPRIAPLSASQDLQVFVTEGSTRPTLIGMDANGGLRFARCGQHRRLSLDGERREPMLPLSGQVIGDEVIVFGPGRRFVATPEAANLAGWTFHGARERHPFFSFASSYFDPTLPAQIDAIEPGAAAAEQPVRPPPRVRMTVNGHSRGAWNTAFRVDAAEPLSRVRFFVDGAEVAAETVTGRRIRGEARIPVPAGYRWLSMVAEDERGVFGAPVGMLVDAPPSRVPKGKLFLVGIAADSYSQLGEAGQLRFAARDVRGFAEAAQAAAGDRYSAVETLTLIDEAAAPNSVVEALDQLATRVAPQDTVIVHIAGHGVLDSGGAFYFLTTEGDPNRLPETALSGANLLDALASLKGRVLVLLDACHSGASDRRFQSNDAFARAIFERARTSDGRIAILAASRGRQVSFERDDLRGGHGVFTNALIEAVVDRRGDVDTNRSGVVELDELHAFVRTRVAETVAAGVVQTPWMARNDLIGPIGLFDSGLTPENQPPQALDGAPERPIELRPPRRLNSAYRVRSMDEAARAIATEMQRARPSLLAPPPMAPPAPASGARPSFECANATGVVEPLICRDTALAALDRELAGLYRDATAPRMSDVVKRQVRDDQRTWLARRNACASAPATIRACVEAAYRERITTLRFILNRL